MTCLSSQRSMPPSSAVRYAPLPTHDTPSGTTTYAPVAEGSDVDRDDMPVSGPRWSFSSISVRHVNTALLPTPYLFPTFVTVLYQLIAHSISSCVITFRQPLVGVA